MRAAPDRSRPRPLASLDPAELDADPELHDLAALAAASVPVATVVIVPSAAEERFYRLNNLPQQLLRAFAAVDPSDPDEDDVEEAAPAARRLIREHFLLDEFVDAFYEELSQLPPDLRVRRGGEDGEAAARGRPALLALKHVYERDWTAEAVLGRLAAGHGIALEARPVLLHAADDGHPAGELSRRASAALGSPVVVSAAQGRVTRVRPA